MKKPTRHLTQTDHTHLARLYHLDVEARRLCDRLAALPDSTRVDRVFARALARERRRRVAYLRAARVFVPDVPERKAE